MKKIYIIMAAAAVAACTKTEIQPEYAQNAGQPEKLSLSFTASVPGVEDTRTSLGEEDGYKTVNWDADDKVRILYGDTYTDADVLENGYINAEVGASEVYGSVYPLLESSLTADGLQMTIPAQQDGSFESANVMAALTNASDRNFAFRNAAGLLSFDVEREDLTKVVIRANDGCPIAGTQKLIFDAAGEITATDVSGAEEKEITVILSGKGTYYVAFLKDVNLATGFGMRFYKGDEPLSGVLSTAPVVLSADVINFAGVPESRINGGDYFIKAGGTGDGSSWDKAAGADLLRSLLNTNISEEVKGDGVTTAWRLHGKTIHVAAGTYDLNTTGLPVTLTLPSQEPLDVTILGGYPSTASLVSLDGRDPSDYKTILTTTTGSILRLDGAVLEMTIDGFIFENGVAEGEESGGGLYCDVVGNVELNDCSFIGCKSGSGGGAVNVSGGSVCLTNCLFKENVADASESTVYNAKCAGGAIRAIGESAKVYIHNSRFDSNKGHVSGDIHIENGASVYLNRCMLYGAQAFAAGLGSSLKYPGCSITADIGVGNNTTKTTLCMLNSTIYDARSTTYTTGSPHVSLMSANALIASTTIDGYSMANIRATHRDVAVDNIHIYNNLFIQTKSESYSINLDNLHTQNDYCNVMGTARNGWKVDPDNKLTFADFIFEDWDMEKGYREWTLNEGKSIGKYAEKLVLAGKVNSSFPDFNKWLYEIESDPYGIDYRGETRNALKMAPGSWDPQL